MQYTYDTYAKNESVEPRRKDTTTNYDEAFRFAELLSRDGIYAMTLVFNNVTNKLEAILDNGDKWLGWRTRLERDYAWKPRMEKSEDPALPLKAKHQFVDDYGFHEKTDGIDEMNKLISKITFDESVILNNGDTLEIDTTADGEILRVHAAVDPAHYQAFFKDETKELQWLETMCRVKRYRENPDVFIGAVELMVRKYLDRNGGKDEEIQEVLKGLWYHKFMAAYIKNGKVPILVKDVDAILARK